MNAFGSVAARRLRAIDRLRATAVASLMLAFSCIPFCAFAQTPAEVGKAAAAAIESLDVQRQLPSEARSPQSHQAQSRVEMIQLPAAPPPDAKDLDSKNPWGTLFQMLLWMAVICAVVLILAFAGVAFPGLRRRTGANGPGGGSEAEDDPVGPLRPAEILLQADRFAASGQYSEAMHSLLVETVALLRRRLDADVSDSLTSRELVKALALAGAEKQAFGDIVARVEGAWFGDRPVVENDYALVRRSFQTFRIQSAGASE